MPGNDDKFREPKVTLNRIYTRSGDNGETNLVGGQRVPKDSLRIECYGTVDELNAFVGMACVTARHAVSESPELAPLIPILERIQHELFNLGSVLATLPADVGPQQPRITAAEIEQLEREMDVAKEMLQPLQSFVLPGGSRLNTELHACRTICRRAERHCVELARAEGVPVEAIHYLNRLSDALFVWSRWTNHILGVPETLWSPNKAASHSRHNTP